MLLRQKSRYSNSVVVDCLTPMRVFSSRVSSCDPFYQIDGYKKSIEILGFLYGQRRAVSNLWRWEISLNIAYTETFFRLVLYANAWMEYCWLLYVQIHQMKLMLRCYILLQLLIAFLILQIMFFYGVLG
jgi:hypothetical protein